MAGKLRVTQTKSTISHIARNRATVRALGLKRIGHTVEIPDNDATRGMVRTIFSTFILASASFCSQCFLSSAPRS